MKFQPYFEVCFSNEVGSFSIPIPVRESHDVIDAPRGGRHTCCQFLDKSDPRQNLVLF